MVADEYLQEGNLTISTNIFMVTPRECRKIDINVGVGVVSISHLAHKHTYIHRAVGDYTMASCIGSMPMYLILVKALCRCVDFARFSFVVFHFSIRKSAYRMAICVSRIFTYFTVHFLIHILSYYRFIIHRPPPPSPTPSCTHSYTHLHTSPSPVPWKIFQISIEYYVTFPHRAHYLITIYTTIKFIVDFLSICCVCALCTYQFAMVID